MATRITQSEMDARRGIKPGVNATDAAKKAYHGYVVGMRRLKAGQEADKRQAGYDKAVEQARGEGQQYAGQIRESVAGLGLQNVGLDQASLAQRAAERANMFQQQQGTLVNRQGAAQRDVSEALQRRLQSSGLRGTGAAERLARVQEAGLAEQAGLQQSELGVAQQQQELAARQGEQQMVIGAQNFIDNMKFQAENTATMLEKSGVDAAKAQNFTAEEAAKARSFQESVLLPMQNAQFDKQMKEQVRQFNEQMALNIKNYNLEKDAQDFNKWLAEKEANKGGMFSNIGQFGTGLWKGTFGALGNLGGQAGGAIGGALGSALGV